MNWLASRSNTRFVRRAYTLVEILVATTLSLLILGAVVQLFGTVGTSITQSRSILESADRLRSAQIRLQMDLEGLTVTPMPPRKPEFNEGYLEIVEGPIMQGQNGPTVPAGCAEPVDTDKNYAADSSVGDMDDILMFTARTTGKPFVGRYGGSAVESDVAEVAWFIRGRTLYRRQLLVAPGLFVSAIAQGFFANNDISVHAAYDGTSWKAYPNTLADLTRRECRFAHPTDPTLTPPYDVRRWSYLGLPTTKETSDPVFVVGFANVASYTEGLWYPSQILAGSPNVMDKFYNKRPDLKNNTPSVHPLFDYWTNNPTARLSDSELINPTTGQTYQGTVVADDVILTNVIGFDVKVWDPLAGLYVDLGNNSSPATTFSGFGNPPLSGTLTTARIYDTWSTTYHGTAASDGFDNTGTGIVDNDSERTAVSPYPTPLRGVQVKIRIFEPDSRQIREVTVEQDFLPK